MSNEVLELRNPRYQDKNVIHELSTVEEYSEMKKLSGVKVVLFSAVWLQPGQRQAKLLEDIFEKSEDFSIFFIDIEKGRDICIKENYMSFPFTLIFKNDIVLDSFLGTIYSSELEAKINSALGNLL